MQPYFLNFPKIAYNNVLLTDIASRLKVTNYNWLSDSTLYYDYTYQEIDTPENIADRYYGDATLHWIILLTNNILDPNFDFPMNSKIFDNYLNKKYGVQANIVGMSSGVQYAQLTTDPNFGYQKYVTVTDYYTNKIISQDYYVVDKNTYNKLKYESIVITKPDGNALIHTSTPRYPLVTIHSRESEINESKRIIKILKQEYKTTIIQSLANLLSNANAR